MTPMPFARWRPRHLFISWMVYWVALVCAGLGPAVPALWRATRPGTRGEISANYGDGLLSLTVQQAGQTTWSGSVSMLTAALWFAIPPLLLWVLWLVSRPRLRRVEMV